VGILEDLHIIKDPGIFKVGTITKIITVLKEVVGHQTNSHVDKIMLHLLFREIQIGHVLSVVRKILDIEWV
jgi:hypothetical protein